MIYAKHLLPEEDNMIDLESVRMRFPEDTNIIVGQTHFIKTAEDMYEAVVNTVPQAKFGLAFNESSGPCLTRAEGNDDELQFRKCGSRILLFLAFVIYL